MSSRFSGGGSNDDEPMERVRLCMNSTADATGNQDSFLLSLFDLQRVGNHNGIRRVSIATVVSVIL